MFFGLQLKQTSPSSLKLSKTLKLSQAVLVPTKNGVKEPVQVIADYENEQFILCILGQSAAWQCPLDVFFAPGSNVKLSLKGTGTVHLTGYEIEEDSDDDLEMSMSSSDEEDEEAAQEFIDKPESSDEEPEEQVKTKMIKTSGKKIPNGLIDARKSARRIEPQRVEKAEDEESSDDDDFHVEDESDEDEDDMSGDDEMLSDEDEMSGEVMSDEELDD